MNTTANLPAKVSPGEIMETVLVKGDLSKLTVDERNNYYRAVCESVGLNPLTKPFEYILLNNKLRLYALKDCTDQLRSLHKISVTDMTESERDGVYIVKSKVQNAEGRTDMAIGAVNIANLKGEALANAMMKTETKSKRRATLSICGLGMLDETEVEDIPRPQVRVPSPSENQEAHGAANAVAAPKHQKPRAIVPEEKDTFDKWTARYIAGLETSTSVAELTEWDKLNSTPLITIRNKSVVKYDQIMDRFDELKAKLMRDSISTGTAPTASKVLPTPKTSQPDGIPNAEQDPEAFVIWATKHMDSFDNPDDLSNIWETEICPAAEGIFKPDFDSMKAYYDKRLAKLGG